MDDRAFIEQGKDGMWVAFYYSESGRKNYLQWNENRDDLFQQVSSWGYTVKVIE